MRHIIIYETLFEADVSSTTEAIERMEASGTKYDVELHTIVNIPCEPVAQGWWSSIVGGE